MFNINYLEKDLAEMAKLDRHRKYEDLRKKRIFDTKQRMIGIDKEALDKQILEKQSQKEEEEAFEKRFILNQNYTASLADEIEKNLNEVKKKYIIETFQISGNTNLINEKKANNSENDLLQYKQEFGISAGQEFEGEDSMLGERKKNQMQQQKSWLTQQMTEKKQKEMEFQLAEKIYLDCLKAQECRSLRLESLEQQCRKQIEKANSAFNQAMKREFIMQKKKKEQQDANDKMMEIINAINSDLLTENPDVAQSNLGRHRIIPYQYKGMNNDEKLLIRQKQIEQLEERKAKMAENETVNKKWEQCLINLDHEVVKQEAIANSTSRNRMKQIMDENKCMSINKQARHLEESKDASENLSEFLGKFNTSSR